MRRRKHENPRQRGLGAGGISSAASRLATTAARTCQVLAACRRGGRRCGLSAATRGRRTVAWALFLPAARRDGCGLERACALAASLAQRGVCKVALEHFLWRTCFPTDLWLVPGSSVASNSWKNNLSISMYSMALWLAAAFFAFFLALALPRRRHSAFARTSWWLSGHHSFTILLLQRYALPACPRISVTVTCLLILNALFSEGIAWRGAATAFLGRKTAGKGGRQLYCLFLLPAACLCSFGMPLLCCLLSVSFSYSFISYMAFVRRVTALPSAAYPPFSAGFLLCLYHFDDLRSRNMVWTPRL